ncbi:MAG: penicillin-binding transpeptidase domain-containing protein [Armatimonadota bacterium]
MNNIDKNIKKLYKLFGIIFVILILYLAYIQFFASGKLHNLASDPRLKENIARRGDIYSANMKTLAFSRQDADNPDEWERFYPYSYAIAQLVGYDNLIYGKSGLEKYLNSYLLFDSRVDSLFKLKRFLKEEAWSGFDCILTIDEKVQLKAYELINGKKGAVVAINPKTGEVLALASSPGFNPNKLNSEWQYLIEDKSAPLIDRCTESVYPPGSTFKVFTLSAALDSASIDETYSINCPGYYKVGKYTLHEAHDAAHGRLNYSETLIYSCNIAFADIALTIGPDLFIKYAKRFGITKKVPLEVPVERAHISRKDTFYSGVLAQSGFGQGEIVITPLQMAMVVSAVANEGKIMKPYLLKEVIDKNFNKIFVNKSRILYNPIDKNTAETVKNIMVDAVNKGTGTRAKIQGVSVAGKTGTAENPGGIEHAWFIGFAPAEDPEVLVCVIVENGGYGGVTAAPIARRVLETALR